jgi:hypothetical protein
VRNSDLVVGLDQVNLVDNFNGTLDDLSTNVQGLEERGLTGVHTSGTGRNEHISGGKSTSTGSGGHLVVQDDLTDLVEIVVGEHETHVTIDELKEILKGGILGSLLLDNLAHQSVLTHEKDGATAESDTGLLHLVGTDVVDLDDEDVLISVKILDQADDILLLADLAGINDFLVHRHGGELRDGRERWKILREYKRTETLSMKQSGLG